jgi:mannose-6-phosphate isomerase-like protein (cupin superfamily)
MRLGDEEAEVSAGDCVVIPPGTRHKLFNHGPDPLVLLCCCAPAYADDDTVMTGR